MEPQSAFPTCGRKGPPAKWCYSWWSLPLATVLGCLEDIQTWLRYKRKNKGPLFKVLLIEIFPELKKTFQTGSGWKLKTGCFTSVERGQKTEYEHPLHPTIARNLKARHSLALGKRKSTVWFCFSIWDSSDPAIGTQSHLTCVQTLVMGPLYMALVPLSYFLSTCQWEIHCVTNFGVWAFWPQRI